MMLALPARVSVFEVAARDGLQNERTFLPVEERIALINCFSEAGFRDIEVGSFVSPRWIPQLVDTGQVLGGIRRRPGTRYWVLVPNQRGLEDALAAHAGYISVFMSASEAHNQSNVNRSVETSLGELTRIIGEARQNGAQVRAYLSTVFGCPYEGRVAPERVVTLARALLEAGARQISLGDTIGVANPLQVTDMMARLSVVAPPDRFALHMHDTRGLALANVLAGLQAGVTVFDSSIAGVGGCPYAAGATGNLATEDLLNMLASMHVDSGIDLEKAAGCGVYLRELLKHDLPGRYHNYFRARVQGEKRR